MLNHSREEPSGAPKTDQWYVLVLCSSDEFKSSSIDKKRSETLHKKKENRASVEFQNNLRSHLKVVLFFSGERFRLERLHRAVKQLQNLRTCGESAAASSQSALHVEQHRLSPVGRPAKSPQVNTSLLPDVPVEVERLGTGKLENSVYTSTLPFLSLYLLYISGFLVSYKKRKKPGVAVALEDELNSV
ncbi:hypothetical protein Bca4012_027662 [Brassica carinata]|uniref:Uncharacterized protein n=1 Tax=Brassica carinata TaxID=52824 RepID=A0A8X7VKW6_BRACI|nr:hypothetical protein Bca52824_024641 [Brassica carinata]